MKARLAGLIALALLAFAGSAYAQSACPNIYYADPSKPLILTPGQWNECFAAKLDYGGTVPTIQQGQVGQLAVYSGGYALSGVLALPNAFMTSDASGHPVWDTTLPPGAIIGGLGYTPVNQAGDTMLGNLTIAPPNSVGPNASLTLQAPGTGSAALVFAGNGAQSAILQSSAPYALIGYDALNGNAQFLSLTGGNLSLGETGKTVSLPITGSTQCLQVSTTGVISGAGAACGSGGGGSGTVNSGTSGQLAYYAATGSAVSGSPIISATASALTVNATGATLPTVGASVGAIFQAGQVSGTQARIVASTNGSQANFAGQRSDGTWAAPTALAANEVITQFTGFGYDPSGYVSSANVAMAMFTANAWTTTDHSTLIVFSTTPSGGLTTTEMMRLQPSGGVSIGGTSFNTTDEGTGTLSAQGSGLFGNGTAVTNAVINATNSAGGGGYYLQFAGTNQTHFGANSTYNSFIYDDIKSFYILSCASGTCTFGEPNVNAIFPGQILIAPSTIAAGIVLRPPAGQNAAIFWQSNAPANKWDLVQDSSFDIGLGDFVNGGAYAWECLANGNCTFGESAKATTIAGSVTFSSITGSAQCLQVNSAGLVAGTGSTCGTGSGGGGTVNAGTTGQVAYYAATAAAVSGSPILSETASLLTVNVSGGALPSPFTNAAIQLGNVSGTATRVEADANNVNAIFTGRRSDGTWAALTALAANDPMVSFNAVGYANGAYASGASAAMNMYAYNAWTATDNSSYISFLTTPAASTTSTLAMLINASGGVSIGSTNIDPGAGSLVVANRINVGTATTTRQINLQGVSSSTIAMDRETTGSGAGQTLSFIAGGAQVGGTNLNGGQINLETGLSTGSGGSLINFYVSGGGASGTADQALANVGYIGYNGMVIQGASGVAQSIQTFANGNTAFFISRRLDVIASGTVGGLAWQGYDSGSLNRNYAVLNGLILSNTAGAYIGEITMQVANAGALITPVTIAGTFVQFSIFTQHNLTGATLPAAPIDSVLQLAQASGSQTRTMIESSASVGNIMFRRAEGTWAAPTATAAATPIGQISAAGYGAAYTASASAAIQFATFNAWSSTDTSSQLIFVVTPSGSTTSGEVMRLANGGDLLIGTTSDGGERLQAYGGTGGITPLLLNSGYNNNITMAYMLQGSLPAGDFNDIIIGVNTSTHNAAALLFDYAGAASTSNYLGLGINGDPLVQINGLGNMTIPGGLVVDGLINGYAYYGQANVAGGQVGAAVQNLSSANNSNATWYVSTGIANSYFYMQTNNQTGTPIANFGVGSAVGGGININSAGGGASAPLQLGAGASSFIYLNNNPIVTNNGEPVIFLNNTASGSSFKYSIQAQKSGVAKAEFGVDIGSNGTDGFYWYNDVTPLTTMTLDPTGILAVASQINAGMGANPTQVSSSIISIAAGLTGSIFMQGTSGGGYIRTGGNASLYLGANDANDVYIDVSGNMAVNISGGGGRFRDGGVAAAGTQTACWSGTSGNQWIGMCTSDSKFKENVTPIEGDVLKPLLALKPVTYHWKTHPADMLEAGFIAQDVQKLFPLTVATDTDGALIFSPANLMPYVVKAIQDDHARLIAAETRIGELTAEIAALKAHHH